MEATVIPEAQVIEAVPMAKAAQVLVTLAAVMVDVPEAVMWEQEEESVMAVATTVEEATNPTAGLVHQV